MKIYLDRWYQPRHILDQDIKGKTLSNG